VKTAVKSRQDFYDITVIRSGGRPVGWPQNGKTFVADRFISQKQNGMHSFDCIVQLGAFDRIAQLRPTR
ncbi:MAG: hypothetical protein ACC669_12405, partial [bacterium]